MDLFLPSFPRAHAIVAQQSSLYRLPPLPPSSPKPISPSPGLARPLPLPTSLLEKKKFYSSFIQIPPPLTLLPFPSPPPVASLPLSLPSAPPPLLPFRHPQTSLPTLSLACGRPPPPPLPRSLPLTPAPSTSPPPLPPNFPSPPLPIPSFTPH